MTQMPLELKDIPEPIGNFILEQKDVEPLMMPDGAYYHYSKVCVMLQRVLTSRFASTPPTTEQSELWKDVMDIMIRTNNPFPLLTEKYSITRKEEVPEEGFTIEDMKEAFESGKHFGETETLHLHTDHVSKQQLEQTSDWDDYIKFKKQKP